MEFLDSLSPLFVALAAIPAVPVLFGLFLLLARWVGIKRIRHAVVIILTPFADWLLRRLTGAVDPKRVRQLVFKDNEIAGHENQGLRIESVPYVEAYWRDDEIEFKPGFVLRNTWIDNWTVLDYKGRFSIARFNTNTKYLLTPDLHIPTPHPLSAALLSFSTRWHPEPEARAYLRRHKDKVVIISISLHLVIRCQREGDDPIPPLTPTISSKLIVHPAPSGTSETGFA